MGANPPAPPNTHAKRPKTLDSTAITVYHNDIFSITSLDTEGWRSLNHNRGVSKTIMTSKKQIEANRLNALLSTGPKTHEGLERAKMNAYRNGFYSRCPVAPWEKPEDYLAHLWAQIYSFRPHTAAEIAEIFTLGEKMWRRNRIPGFELESMDGSLTRAEMATELDKLSQYEERMDRGIDRSLRRYFMLIGKAELLESRSIPDEAAITQALETHFKEKGIPYQSGPSMPAGMPRTEEEGVKWKAHLEDIALGMADNPVAEAPIHPILPGNPPQQADEASPDALIPLAHNLKLNGPQDPALEMPDTSDNPNPDCPIDPRTGKPLGRWDFIPYDIEQIERENREQAARESRFRQQE